MDDRIRNEQLEVRLFTMRLVRRLWVVAAGALVCALLCLLLYTAVTQITRPVRYTAKTESYLYYVENASADRVYHHYNDYTWNDIIHTDAFLSYLTDDAVISDYQQLSAEGANGAAETALAVTQGKAEITATLPSDLRLFHMIAVSADETLARDASLLMTCALQAYAIRSEVVRDIEILTMPEADKVSYPARAGVAAAAGAVIGILLSLLYLHIDTALDERITVPEEAQRRYALPVIACIPALFPEEEADNLRALAKKGKRFLIVSDPKDIQAQDVCAEFPEKIPADLKDVLSVTAQGEADASLIVIRAGVKNDAMYRHLIAQAESAGHPAAGLILAEADTDFLKRYYRR